MFSFSLSSEGGGHVVKEEVTYMEGLMGGYRTALFASATKICTAYGPHKGIFLPA